MSTRPTVNTFRKRLASSLGADYHLGGAGIHRDLEANLRVSIVTSSFTSAGHRGVSGSISLYRPQDWADWLAKWNEDPDTEFAGTAEAGDFAFVVGSGQLLERPHAHRWSINSREELSASVDHIASLIVSKYEPLIPDWASMLPNQDGFLKGRLLLGIPDGAWLDIVEPCPWRPCLEVGRRVDAGGVEPDDGLPYYAASSR